MKQLRLLICLLLCALAANVTTFAQVAQIGSTQYATLEDAFTAAQDGETITLLSNCSGNGIVVPQGKFTTGLTVDFGGHTYTVSGDLVGSTGTETNGFQLLKDNKITFSNGTITSTKAKILVQNYSDLTLNGMTLTLNNPNYTGAYTLSNNNGDVVINNTTINANPAGGYAFDVCRYASYPSVSVTVTGTSVINGDIEVSASNSDAKDGFSLNLNSGTLNGDIVLNNTAKAAMEATPDKAVVQKSANFSATAPTGYAWQSNGTLAPIVPVAQIGSTQYATLEDAFAAAQDGETITLLSNCSGNGIVVPQGKFTTGLTVDFGGHTYTVDADLVGSTGTETNGFQLLKDNNITFNNGTIFSMKAKILVQNYSNLTLNGMALTLANQSYSGSYTLSNNNGNVLINNTNIINGGDGYAFDVCRYANYPSVNVTVTGTSTIFGDIEVYASNSDPKDGFSLTLDSGTLNGNIVVDHTARDAMEANPSIAVVRQNDTFNATAPTGFVWQSEGNGNSVLVPLPAVAVIGNNKYASLYDAVQDAQAGDVITMIDNSTETATSVVRSAITIDLNGKTVTCADSVFSVNADLTVTDSSENGGGTINAGSQGSWVKSGATFTLEKITMTASSYGIIISNGHVVVNNNATLNGGSYGIFCQTTATNTVTVNSGTVQGTKYGAYMATGSVTMNGGAITGTSYGVRMLANSGNLTMNRGTISATGSSGRAINSVSSGTVSINGGTVTSPYMGVQITAGNLTQTGGNITATASNGIAVYSSNTSTIGGGTISSPYIGYYLAGGNLTMNDGTINATTSNGMALYQRNGTATINGGSITSSGDGAYMTAGTLVLNDGTISSTGINGKYAIFSSGANVTIDGGTVSGNGWEVVYLRSSSKFTMNDGNIRSTSNDNEALLIAQSSIANLNGGKIDSSDCGVYIHTTGGTVNLNGTTINADGIGIANHGNTIAANATTMNITDGEINANLGIYHPGMGFLNISGGTITGITNGIVFRNGKLDISGGTIHATGPANPYDFHSSGSSPTGDALQIERSHYGGEDGKGFWGQTFDGKTYAGTEVNISYGIFISDNADAVHSYIKSDDSKMTGDGADRCLYFLTNGWYSNQQIPVEHCDPSVAPDPTAHELNAPDMRAQYTIYTPLYWIEGRDKDNIYTVSDRLLGVYAIGHSLWCKDVDYESNAKTEPTAEQEDYMADLLNRNTNTDPWDQSNWIELHFGDDVPTDSLQKYVNKYIKEATVFGELSDKLNYRLEVDYTHTQSGKPLLFTYPETETYVPNTYCAANFNEDYLNLKRDGTDEGAVSPISGNQYYFLNPKVQEFAIISFVIWNGEMFVVPYGDGSNTKGFDGSFNVDMKFNIYGDVRSDLTNRLNTEGPKAYQFHAIIQRTDGSTYGPSYAPGPKPGQTPSSNIVVCPIDLQDQVSVITGVNVVNATKSVVGVKYVNVAGLVSDRPFDGVNIVVTKYSDGSYSTTKQVR